jgi:metal-responsive CopG/Arc/MetJ family transcriptional regulator
MEKLANKNFIGVTLPQETREQLDAYMIAKGIKKTSQACRELIQAALRYAAATKQMEDILTKKTEVEENEIDPKESGGTSE